jgi:iron(II)-dependent oxidoreductase
MAIKLFSKKKVSPSSIIETMGAGQETTGVHADDYQPAPKRELESDPLQAMFNQQQYNNLLRNREQWADHPQGTEICRRAIEKLDQEMALVPSGRSVLPKTMNDVEHGDVNDVLVSSFLLDVHAVTNARYQEFVDGGGYEDLSLWPETIWTHLIQMKDQTDHPGPRFWRDGRHDQRYSEHPVVGISWYEAAAYARWIGKRLPTEAEWQLAASWRIMSDTDVLYRFPWGDAMDRKKCNIWASGHGTTVPVNEYERGAAPNGVLQLVGNVWEWVDAEVDLTTDQGAPVVGDMAMKVVRGGAFDAYFESQATSLFRTGYNALTRVHNVGLRCAVSLAEASWLSEAE